MSDEELLRAESNPNASTRLYAYDCAKKELSELDPSGPNSGPEWRPKGWSPSSSDINRLRVDLADAKDARRNDLTPEQYRDLARDPAQGGKITSKTREERATIMDAWRSGTIKGPPKRDTLGGDFKDANGDLGMSSRHVPACFHKVDTVNDIRDELSLGENVLVNTANMKTSDVEHLKTEAKRLGWGDRVQFATSLPSYCPVGD